MFDIDIREKFPDYYDNVLEIDTLSDVEMRLLLLLQGEFTSLVKSQWILTADLAGVARYEKMLNIVPSSADSLDFRRERIITRINQAAPYTITYLVRWLNVYLGQNQYELTMEYDNYLLTLTVHIGEYGKLDELIKSLVEIMPSNIGRVVNNEIICYNFTEENFGGAVSLGHVYRLSQDINERYAPSAPLSKASVSSTGKVYRLSQDISQVYELETVRHNGAVVSSASITTLV